MVPLVADADGESRGLGTLDRVRVDAETRLLVVEQEQTGLSTLRDGELSG